MFQFPGIKSRPRAATVSDEPIKTFFLSKNQALLIPVGNGSLHVSYTTPEFITKQSINSFGSSIVFCAVIKAPLIGNLLNYSFFGNLIRLIRDNYFLSLALELVLSRAGLRFLGRLMCSTLENDG